jgi:hypothetical protein
LDETLSAANEAADVETLGEFDVGKFEVEIVDERPEEDQRAPATEEALTADDDGEPTEEELRDVGARVKKRIDSLTFKLNDQRRKAESADQMREEAVRYAQMQKTENDHFRTVIDKGQDVLIAEVRNRTKADVERAQQQYSMALEEGDPGTIAKAQMTLNKAQIEQHSAEAFEPPPSQTPNQPQQQQQPTPVQNPGVPEPELEAWRSRNDWFNVDPGMSAYAMKVHEQIAMNSASTGVIVGTRQYYDAIDARMKEAFPSKYETGAEDTSESAASPAPPVVAPAARGNASAGSPRKVQLTETQAALAKRLNVPLDVYAREVLKLGGN